MRGQQDAVQRVLPGFSDLGCFSKAVHANRLDPEANEARRQRITAGTVVFHEENEMACGHKTAIGSPVASLELREDLASLLGSGRGAAETSEPFLGRGVARIEVEKSSV